MLKLLQKQYGIVVLGILLAKIDLKKPEEIKEKIVIENASICAGMKIEGIFWFSILKKDKQISSVVVEIANTKIAELLIQKRLVLDHTLQGWIKYNSACEIKQSFNCYEYNYISIHYQKSTKCIAC